MPSAPVPANRSSTRAPVDRIAVGVREDVEQRLAQPVGGRAQAFDFRPGDRARAQSAADDAHYFGLGYGRGPPRAVAAAFLAVDVPLPASPVIAAVPPRSRGRRMAAAAALPRLSRGSRCLGMTGRSFVLQRRLEIRLGLLRRSPARASCAARRSRLPRPRRRRARPARTARTTTRISRFTFRPSDSSTLRTSRFLPSRIAESEPDIGALLAVERGLDRRRSACPRW